VVCKVNYGLLESLWLGTHGVPHKPNSSLDPMICQVYCCPYKKQGEGGGSRSIRSFD
jgi:hypothetical protein